MLLDLGSGPFAQARHRACRVAPIGHPDQGRHDDLYVLLTGDKVENRVLDAIASPSRVAVMKHDHSAWGDSLVPIGDIRRAALIAVVPVDEQNVVVADLGVFG